MTHVSALQYLEDEIANLEQHGLLRTHQTLPRDALVMCSNDYLGYANEPWPHNDDKLIASTPSGAGASRLVSGEHPTHALAEHAIATWLDQEAALLFSSGYAANTGTIAALARPGDVIVSDTLNHASIIDGCRLSGATIVVVPHCNAAAEESALENANGAKRRWVITESLFSMDGDSPDFVRLRLACDRYRAALIVDEAHALGALGPGGRGITASLGVKPDVLVGTLGKALGLQGAFVAGPRILRSWLWNRARSFVFSTGISPTLALAVVHRVARIAEDDTARHKLAMSSTRLRAGLRAIVGSALAPTHGPIFPCIVGTPEQAVRVSTRLRELGIVVQAIRPPTVPAGTSRLRVTARANLTDGELHRFMNGFQQAWNAHVTTTSPFETWLP